MDLQSESQQQQNPPAVIPAQAGIQSYCEAMDEIKFRTEQALLALKGEIKFKRNDLSTEFVCLQVRKILELIVLSSFVADEEHYVDVGSLISEQRKIKDILKKLREYNPGFYPGPIGKFEKKEKREGADNTFWCVESGEPKKKGKNEPLSEEELLILYKECSRCLHVPNIKKEKPQKLFSFSLDVWIKKTVLLLQHHTINLAGSDQLWVVKMNGVDKDVEWAICTPAISGSPPSLG